MRGSLIFKMESYVIAFFDVGIELYCKTNDDGEVIGEVMRFKTRKEAQKFLDTLDSREFDRFILLLKEQIIKRYEK